MTEAAGIVSASETFHANHWLTLAIDQRVDHSDAMGIISRRTVLAGTVATAATLQIPSAASADRLTIVDRGRARAMVITPDAPDTQIAHAVADLVRYIKQASGAELGVQPVTSANADDRLVKIYVGLASPRAEQSVQKALAKLGDEGFVIHPDGSSITVLGRTSRGTRYGVYEFLERYVGVRWLLPGPLGEDVPLASTIAMSGSQVRSTPHFLMRHCSPYNSGTADTSTSTNINLRWGAYLRTTMPVQMSHNLANLITVAKFGNPKLATYRPDFFPILTEGGGHFIPPATQKHGWQPRFTADGIAEAAAGEIIAYLRARPTVRTYSLGINDNHGFSLDNLSSELNSSGVRSASEAYYHWVNEVAERVSAEFPEVALGLLAYTGVADPPSFPLHDNVIPFLTRDRGCWIFPEGEALDRETTLAWRAVSRNVGWYDYRTGGAWIAPRIDLSAIARAYRFAQQVGVRYVYAECYARWGEGAKQWIYNKLLWDPTVDVYDLQREWSQRLVGRSAAGDLVAFQRLWERVWTDKIADSEWIRVHGYRQNYLVFIDPGYLASVDPSDATEARRLLDRVSARAATPQQQDRAALLQKAFEYVEASVLSYPRPEPAPSRARQAIQQVDAVTETLDRNIRMAARRQEWLNENRSDPLFGSTLVLRTQGIQWSGWNLYPLWTVSDYLRQHEPHGGPVRQHVEAVAEHTDSANVRRYAMLLLAAADGHTRLLGENVGFDGPDLQPWLVERGVPTNEPVEQSTEVTFGNSGKSMRIPLGFGSGGVSQEFPVQPGAMRATIQYYVSRGGNPGDAAIRPTWQFYDGAKKLIEIDRGRTQLFSRSVGRWRSAEMAEMVPSDAITGRLYFSLSRTDRAHNVLYLDAGEFRQIVEP